MPGCVLRVAALKATVVAFLPASSFTASAIFTRGERRFARIERRTRQSGFNVAVSNADGSDLAVQVRDAIRFLRRHRASIERLRTSEGFRSATLDFGLWDLTSEERPWPSYRIDSRLVIEAGRLGLGIDLSFYGCPQDTAEAGSA